jgi:hypothetical protein
MTELFAFIGIVVVAAVVVTAVGETIFNTSRPRPGRK